ncbi:MFS-type transporter SLC18B1-like isoform X2 [Lineus longissimus]|uniref:MFS-type transporter SLC18B1-like isoform X2 n=1 Tax=Lineus longissimus TaxID=88925 RepID=UPI00315D08FD
MAPASDFNENNHDLDPEMTERPLSTKFGKDTEEEKPQKDTLLFCDIVCIASLLSVNLFFSCGYSLLAPFFPKEAAKKGVSVTMTGAIFASYEFANLLFSPLVGAVMSKVTPKYLFLGGCIFGAVTTSLYGFLDMAQDTRTFTTLCFILRIADALASAICSCTGMTILTSIYPSRVSTLIGLSETSVGTGFMVGPALGGALYQAGGFEVPFFVVGACILISAFPPMCLIPKQLKSADQVLENSPSIWRLLTRPAILMSCLSYALAMLILNFQNPVLGKHLEQFHLGPAVMGLVFIIAPCAFTIAAPLMGFVTDKWKCGRTCTVVGTFVLSALYLIMGPFPLFHLQPALWMTAVPLLIQGLAAACTTIAGFTLILEDAKKVGFPDSMGTKGLVSGLVMFSFNFGAFVGPLMAGALVGAVGYGWACSVVSLVSFVVAIIFSITYGVLRYQQRSLSEPETPFLEDDKNQLNESSHILMRKIPTYSSPSSDKPSSSPSSH